MLELNLEKKVAKYLTSLKEKNLSTAKRIIIRIKDLQYNPSGADTKLLKGGGIYRRARVGKYRIVYKSDDKILFVILIAKRDEIYKHLSRL